MQPIPKGIHLLDGVHHDCHDSAGNTECLTDRVGAFRVTEGKDNGTFNPLDEDISEAIPMGEE